MSSFYPSLSSFSPLATRNLLAKRAAAPAVVSEEEASPRVLALSAAAGPAHDLSYYSKCMVGGALSCGLTHTAIVPLDLIKCRMQTNPGAYKSLVDGFKVISREAGVAGLTIGWHATLIGYSIQGLFKFGLYELFKDVYSNMAGEENAWKYRTYLYLAASASAEVFADIGLCPMESVKVRIQTSPPEAKFPTGLGAAIARIKDAEGVTGFYKGLSPLWMRQVPYTMVKFAAFERTVEAFYTYLFTAPKSSYSKATQLSVTFASGYFAGVFCAVVSHPADTVVSKLNQSQGGSIGSILRDLGFAGMWRGLGTRIIMVGTLTGLQWWIYDTFKSLVGLQTSGGK